jgi:NAD(P)-dependent dehydrogenase (short-subunit alcohol dehydrogenase family)
VPWHRRPAKETSEQILSLGRASQSFAADLSQPDGADSLYQAVLGAMGAPDVVVNNAGTIYREPAENHDLQAWMFKVISATGIVNKQLSLISITLLARSTLTERRQLFNPSIESALFLAAMMRVSAARYHATALPWPACWPRQAKSNPDFSTFLPKRYTLSTSR